MSRLRVNEAIARAEMHGNKILKKDLAAKLWEDSTPTSQQVNMTNLCSGITKKINPEWVETLCSELSCDANFLFGINQPKEDN